MSRLNHNKKRNIGLVYELLAREVAAAVIEPKRAPRAAVALEIIDSHLGPKSQLNEELSLHRNVMESQGCTPTLARRIVDELRAASLRLGSRANRESAKTALIHEVNRRLGAETFSQWIPDYTAHASVGLILSRGLAGQLSEGVEAAKIEEYLIGFLSSRPTPASSLDPDRTLHTYRTAVGLFEEEYGSSLTADQSALLKENVRVALGGPVQPLERLVAKQKASLRETLQRAQADEVFKNDADMSKALDEAIVSIDAIQPTEEGVERLMLYHNLLKEIDSK